MGMSHYPHTPRIALRVGFLLPSRLRRCLNNKSVDNGVDWFSIYEAEELYVWVLPQLSRPDGLLKAGATQIQSLRDCPAA